MCNLSKRTPPWKGNKTQKSWAWIFLQHTIFFLVKTAFHRRNEVHRSRMCCWLTLYLKLKQSQPIIPFSIQRELLTHLPQMGRAKQIFLNTHDLWDLFPYSLSFLPFRNSLLISTTWFWEWKHVLVIWTSRIVRIFKYGIRSGTIRYKVLQILNSWPLFSHQR